MSELDLFKQTIANQYEATLCTLSNCIDRCPNAAWHAPVCNLRFCQAVFHTLIFTDLYLGPDKDAIFKQPFHQENKAFFGDYEEFEDRRQVAVYEKEPTRTYLQHCRKKASDVIAAETSESLAAPSGFDWIKAPRAELHVYNIRHIQHHAAQLSLRMRIDTNENISWVKSGWPDS